MYIPVGIIPPFLLISGRQMAKKEIKQQLVFYIKMIHWITKFWVVFETRSTQRRSINQWATLANHGLQMYKLKNKDNVQTVPH